jgi:CRISPR/Cas system-associated endonuclease Cas3-HD
MIDKIIKKAIEYDAGDPRRVHHLLKVHSFAKTIGTLENLGQKELQILEIAAILHDIGIHECERKYSSTGGNFQEIEGPPIAKELLEEFNLPEDVLERVLFLIGHHHTYSEIDGADYQILVEADFLVNIYEDSMDEKQVKNIKERIFKTSSGKYFLEKLYLDAKN